MNVNSETIMRATARRQHGGRVPVAEVLVYALYLAGWLLVLVGAIAS